MSRTHDATKLLRNNIYIPGAKGQAQLRADQAAVSLCTEEERRNATTSAVIQREFLALVRLHHVFKTWDYDGADEDSVRYAALLRRHAPRAAVWLRGRFFGDAEQNVLPGLVEGLLVGARALGLEDARSRDLAGLVSAMLRPLPANTKLGEEPPGSNWEAMRWRLRALRVGDKQQLSALDLVLDYCGARQGGAGLVHAIDVKQLLPHVEAVRQRWTITQIIRAPNTKSPLQSVAQRYSGLRQFEKALTEAAEEFSRWHARAIAWLGDHFDKSVIDTEIREAIAAAKRLGLAEIDSERVGRHRRAFVNSAIKAALDAAGRLQGDTTAETRLAVLAEDHATARQAFDQLQTEIDNLFTAIEKALARQNADEQLDAMSTVADEVTRTLDRLDTILAKLAGEAR